MRLLLVVLLSFSVSVCCAQVDSLLNIGRGYAGNRDFENALLYFNKALDNSKSSLDNGRVLNNIGLLYMLQANQIKAIYYFDSAINRYLKVGNIELAAQTYLNKGSAYRRNGQFEKASESYKLAFSKSKLRRTKKSALNNIGRLTFSTGEYQKGIEYFKSLIEKTVGVYQIHQNLARLYAKTNQIESAVNSYNKAIRIYGIQFSPVTIELNKELGDMLYATGMLKDATQVYSDALYSCDQLQKLYLIDQTKLKSGEMYKDIYLSAIECAAKLKNDVWMLNLMERFKAPVLSEKIRENALPDSVKIELKKLDHEITKALTNEFDGLDRIIEIKEQLLESYPVPEPKNYKEVIEDLPNDMGIVHYALSDSLLTTFIKYGDHSETILQPIGKQFYNDVELVSRNTKMFSGSTLKKYKHYMNALNRLYLIFRANYPKDCKRLLILPYGELYRIPFEALTNTEASNRWADYTNVNYLVNDYAISYSASISSLQTDLERHSNKAVSFVPSYSVDTLQLRFNKAEAEELSRNFDTDIFDGEKATSENFFNEIGNYDIISVISHGNSGEIVLDKDTIHADELYQLNLNNSLTVLSACESNTGELQSVEGYFGTARKFIEAGSHSVLASGWAIPDESTQKILSEFYANLSNGDPKDIALQKAKVNFLNNTWSVHRSPAFWSGVVLIGNSTKLNTPSSGYLYVVLVVLVFFFLITFVIKYLRRFF